MSANHCGGRLGSISIGNIRNGAGAAIDATPEIKIQALSRRFGASSCCQGRCECGLVSGGGFYAGIYPADGPIAASFDEVGRRLYGLRQIFRQIFRLVLRQAFIARRPSDHDGRGTFGDSVSQLSVFGGLGRLIEKDIHADCPDPRCVKPIYRVGKHAAVEGEAIREAGERVFRDREDCLAPKFCAIPD